MKTIVIIPARLKSTRLPNKPLADIHGKPMIQHVWERAQEATIGKVFVACCDEDVYETVLTFGGVPILTDPDLPSGSDRIYEAYGRIGESADSIICLQGDLPAIDPILMREVLNPLKIKGVDMATLVAPILDPEELEDPHVVKASLKFQPTSSESGRAVHFSRTPTFSSDNNDKNASLNEKPPELYHHIGIYAYSPQSLHQFVSLPQSPLEKKERLEQLRALENGMRIEARVVHTIPFGVDTEQDLEKIRHLMAPPI